MRPTRTADQRLRAPSNPPATALELIETEHGRLRELDSLLGCVILALEYADAADAPCVPDVVRHARSLLGNTLRTLEKALDRAASRHEVRDEVRALTVTRHDPQPADLCFPSASEPIAADEHP